MVTHRLSPFIYMRHFQTEFCHLCQNAPPSEFIFICIQKKKRKKPNKKICIKLFHFSRLKEKMAVKPKINITQSILCENSKSMPKSHNK